MAVWWEIKGVQNLQATQASIYLTWCDDGYYTSQEYLASEKSVLASESNLSLATGLASWNVSLEPCKQWISLSLFDFQGLHVKFNITLALE